MSARDPADGAPVAAGAEPAPPPADGAPVAAGAEPAPPPAADPAPRPTDGAPVAAVADEPVPRLPRGRGIKLSGVELFRIAGLAMVLVVLLLLQRPCSNAVATFVTGFGDRGSAATEMPRPGAVDVPGGPARSGSGTSSAPAGSAETDTDPMHYEHLRPGMSDEEIKAAIERARRRAGAAGP